LLLHPSLLGVHGRHRPRTHAHVHTSRLHAQLLLRWWHPTSHTPLRRHTLLLRLRRLHTWIHLTWIYLLLRELHGCTHASSASAGELLIRRGISPAPLHASRLSVRRLRVAAAYRRAHSLHPHPLCTHSLRSRTHASTHPRTHPRTHSRTHAYARVGGGTRGCSGYKGELLRLRLLLSALLLLLLLQFL
jgi:hypothetical protein